MRAIERAAGGMVVRGTGDGMEVLMIDDAYGKLSFPKGHVDPGESWEQAALREVAEETGVAARILAPLGRTEYLIVKDGQTVRKQVRLFLLEALDETTTPVPQQEELVNARYLSWSEAARQHAVHGYENWRWIFRKAAWLLRWHEDSLDATWRSLPAATDDQTLDAVWVQVRPLVVGLVQTAVEELLATAPELGVAAWREQAGVQIPAPLDDVATSLSIAIEHTLLKAEASAADVAALCQEAREFNLGIVCLNPQHVPLAASLCAHGGPSVCAVAGFPLGAVLPDVLAAEVSAVVTAGAREVDMVIPVGSMAEDDIWTVSQHVRAAATAAHAQGAALKVILEAYHLSVDQLAKASLVALAAGADFLKTSTGFAPGGARVADVAMMRLVAGSSAGVKAAGGIRSKAEARQFLRYGASRIGTSSGPQLVR